MNTNQPTTETPQSRAEFIRSLGLSSAALMSLYCMGTLTSCSSSESPAPATPTTPTTPTPPAATGVTGNADPSKGKVDFTIDLTNTNYSKLKTVGEYVNVGDLVVANAKGSKYVAIGRICTHAAGDLQYQLNADEFKCNVHQSLFGIDGKVKPGQIATRDVKAYKTTLSTNGNSLQVTE